MMSRRAVLGLVMLFLGAPVFLVLTDAVSYRSANRSNGSFMSGGMRREYLLYVPPSYNRSKPAPLVISFHGAGGWPVQQRDVSGWNRLADREGFIVVYPAGADEVGPRIWHVERGSALGQDVGFIAALIDTLESKYNIDPARIYANGLSNGGGMSFALSCMMPNRLAAVGMVAAAQTLPWSWCTDRHPVPMIAFHGTADPDVPYNGGTSWIAPDTFPNMMAWTKEWAARNQCAGTPRDVVIAPDVTRIEYAGCAGNATVQLYTIIDGGHSWPGGAAMPEWFVGRTSSSVNATELMWEFFRAHPLTARDGKH